MTSSFSSAASASPSVIGAVLEAARRRHTQSGRTVLEAPIGEHRRPKAGIPQPAIRVHRGAADGGQAAEMPDDAADRLQSDLAGKLNVVGVWHEGVIAAGRVGIVLRHAWQ